MALSVLYIGGTGQISLPCVEKSLAAGHNVTVLNRGKSSVALPDGVESVIGEVGGGDGYANLGDRKFDVVCQFRLYTPEQMEHDIATFSGRTDQYVFISSASAYQKPARDYIITEKTPVARWAVDGVTFLIDGRGEQIAETSPAYSGLPLVIGDGAADDALGMIRALNGFPLLQDGLVALSRIADRRWDLIFDTGLRVQLPEQGVAQAMARLVTYQNDYQLLDRDVSVIDLRVDSVVAVRPNKPDENTDKS